MSRVATGLWSEEEALATHLHSARAIQYTRMMEKYDYSSYTTRKYVPWNVEFDFATGINNVDL
jgi:hypothetical protein